MQTSEQWNENLSYDTLMKKVATNERFGYMTERVSSPDWTKTQIGIRQEKMLHQQ